MPSQKAGTTLRKKYGRIECPGTILIVFSRSKPSKSVTQEAIDHHRKAAEHHEHAARHNKEIATHHASGSHEKARHHAHLALGHHLHATYHAEEAAKHLAEEDRSN